MKMAKYLLVCVIIVFGIYIYPYVDELGILIGVTLCLCFMLWDVTTFIEKIDAKNKDVSLRFSLHIAFPAPEFAPEGKQVIIERLRVDEYQVYTIKGTYSFVAERGPFDLIFGIKKEKLSDIDFSNIIA